MTRIATTSAVVLLWAGEEPYRTAGARAYLKRLDLNAGRALYDRCQHLWSHYGEVIRNRKVTIMRLMERLAAENQGLQQVVIAGAGQAPLSLEWCELYPVHRVFDLDWDYMEEKRALARDARVNNLDRVAFLTVDNSSADDIRQALQKADWDPEQPTLLVLEGISCYLSIPAIRQMIGLFWTRDASSRVVLEYLKPFEAIEPSRRHIPEKNFGIVALHCGLKGFTHLSADILSGWKDVSLLENISMRQMELWRTGRNRFFPTDESGWIEIALLAV